MPQTPSVLSCVFATVLTLTGSLFVSVTAAQEIVAHRGASHDAPENTLAAFRLAWDQGADAIEGDFRLTADGQVVCLHDADTKRVTGGEVDWKVSEVMLEKLRTLDVGKWKGESFAGERIPTLAEVLAIIPPGKKLFLEIKGGPELVEPIRRVLVSSGISLQQIVIIAFDQNTVMEVRRLLPEVKVHWLVSYKQDKETGRWTPTADEVFQTLSRIRAHGVDTEANPEVVKWNGFAVRATNSTFGPSMRAIAPDCFATWAWTRSRPTDRPLSARNCKSREVRK